MPGRPPRERPLRPVLYSPASRGKLPSPSGEGCSENLSVHPSTKAGQLHRSTYTFSELLDIWMNGWAFHQDYPAEAETYDRLKAAVPDWFWFGVQSAVLPLTGVILDLDDLVADLLGKDRVPRIATRT